MEGNQSPNRKRCALEGTGRFLHAETHRRDAYAGRRKSCSGREDGRPLPAKGGGYGRQGAPVLPLHHHANPHVAHSMGQLKRGPRLDATFCRN